MWSNRLLIEFLYPNLKPDFNSSWWNRLKSVRIISKSSNLNERDQIFIKIVWNRSKKLTYFDFFDIYWHFWHFWSLNWSFLIKFQLKDQNYVKRDRLQSKIDQIYMEIANVDSNLLLELDSYRNWRSNLDGLESESSTIWFKGRHRLT